MTVANRHKRGGKLGKLVRLLASDKPGEAAAAAAAINRALQSAGLDIHALAEAVDRAPLVPQQAPDPPPSRDRSWREIRQWCAEHEEFLSDREFEFVSSLARWRGRLTEKQQNWLFVIEEKIRARQART